MIETNQGQIALGDFPFLNMVSARQASSMTKQLLVACPRAVFPVCHTSFYMRCFNSHILRDEVNQNKRGFYIVAGFPQIIENDAFIFGNSVICLSVVWFYNKILNFFNHTCRTLRITDLYNFNLISKFSGTILK